MLWPFHLLTRVVLHDKSPEMQRAFRGILRDLLLLATAAAPQHFARLGAVGGAEDAVAF